MKIPLIGMALACLHVTMAPAQQKQVTLDSYFNDEHKKDASGKMVSFHYKWEETGNNGYSILGDLFKANGARLHTLYEAPTAANLKGSAIYIIVDPDNAKESPAPHYIGQQDVRAIQQWVKDGGVLVMLANDSANTELVHFNELAAAFGLHFNNDIINHVTDDAHFEDGAITVKDHPVFRTTKKIFMKDACSITVRSPGRAVLTSKGATIIAATAYGKGSVVAIGDPWLYNEYVNGRLPAGYENDKAAADLVKWLLAKAPQR
jgi:unsaturated rhamnogalacturonyl hydrolase